MENNGTIRPRVMRDSLLQAVYEEMLEDSNIFFVSADFGSPVLDKIRTDCPDRFVNVGIAEQNLINVSAGLALEEFKVFAYAIAPFITMRCFEQIRVNLALLSEVRDMNVSLIGVGAGYSYVVSGPTHQCYEDITLMRAMPNMQVVSVSDQILAEQLPGFCLTQKGIKYLRLDAQLLPLVYEHDSPHLHEGFNQLKAGKDICLLSTGYMTHTAQKVSTRLAEKGIDVGIIDIFNISHFNKQLFNSVISEYQTVVTMEEGFCGRGGLDAMLFNHNSQYGLGLNIINVGVQGGYRFEIGDREKLHEVVGIGVDAVVNKIINQIK